MASLFITSDWHGDWYTDGYSRHDDLRQVLFKQVLPQVEEGDYFAFLGDVSNPFSRDVHLAVSLEVEVACELKAKGVHQQVWMTGNHDVVEDSSGSHTLMALKPLEAMAQCKVIDRPVSLRFAGLNVLMLPFTSPVFDYSPEEVVEQTDGEIDMVFGHLNLRGITPGSESTDMPRGRDVYFPVDAIKKKWPKARMYNGHYHEQQVFDGVRIPGSLLRLTHGEEQNRPGYFRVPL